jgi:hypothetical protein
MKPDTDLSMFDGMPPLTRYLIPRVSDMGDGTFRPEVVYNNDDSFGGIHFGTPVGSFKEAHRLAVEACGKGVRAATVKPKLTPAERAERKAKSALRIQEGVEGIKRQMIALGMLTPDGKPPGRTQ